MATTNSENEDKRTLAMLKKTDYATLYHKRKIKSILMMTI